MAFFRLIPNLTIMAPKDFKELEDMMEFAVNVGKPVVIRYPRGGEGKEKFKKKKKTEIPVIIRCDCQIIISSKRHINPYHVII